MRDSGHIQGLFRTHLNYIQVAFMKHTDFTLFGCLKIDGHDRHQDGQDSQHEVTRGMRTVTWMVKIITKMARMVIRRVRMVTRM